MVKRTMTRPLRILIIQCEFTSWHWARAWSYSWGLGLEEGLAANQVEFLVVTTTWLAQARSICAGRQFDQIWINDLPHSGGSEGVDPIDEAVLDWLTNVAPIRIGFFMETIGYTEEELTEFPQLAERVSKWSKGLDAVTHIVTLDEKDATYLAERTQLPVFWAPSAVPKRWIQQPTEPPQHSAGLFAGSIYGRREEWLASDFLRERLTRQPSSEAGTLLPLLFDWLPGHRFRRSVLNYWPLPAFLYPAYLSGLRALRRQSYARWLQSLQSGTAVVNLPHLLKAYTCRVVEGMAAGRPVISWQIPERPRNRALFVEGEEILLYKTPDELAAQIERVLSDSDFAQQLAQNARKKIKQWHTIEKRVEQILHWVDSGEVPTYGTY